MVTASSNIIEALSVLDGLVPTLIKGKQALDRSLTGLKQVSTVLAAFELEPEYTEPKPVTSRESPQYSKE